MLANVKDGGLSCKATNESFPYYLMSHNKIHIHTRPRPEQGESWASALPYMHDLCFTIHVGIPGKARVKKGEENRHRQVFNFQIKQVCSACFLCFFRIDPKEYKPKGNVQLPACTSRDSPQVLAEFKKICYRKNNTYRSQVGQGLQSIQEYIKEALTAHTNMCINPPG